MVSGAMITLAIISVLSLIFIFVGAIVIKNGFLQMWAFKGSMMTINITSTGGLVYAIHKFFDTREAKIRSSDRLALRKEKNYFKLEKYKIKNKV